MRKVLLGMMLVMGVLVLVMPEAMASGTGSGGLPYESALEKVQESLSGPVATSLSIIGICLSGAMLIFGGDMNGFFRGLCMVVLVCSLMVGAKNILSTLGIAGATIGVSAVMTDEPVGEACHE